MSTSWKYIPEHLPVLKGLAQTAVAAVMPRDRSAKLETPGPIIECQLPARSRGLIDAYVRNVGGAPSAYRNALPPHMFPQWGFGPASKTLAGIPYPVAKVVNGGARFQVNAPLDPSAPLIVSAQLVNIDDNGKRAVMEQRIITGNPDNPEALVATLFAIVPLPRPKDAPRGPKKPKATVPMDVREVGELKLRANAGLDFAKLTGDFNPIHWIPAYAKMSGFKSTILHGFGTMARAIECINANVYSGDAPIVDWDCQFTRPLALPARVRVFISASVGDGEARSVWVGDAPGAAAYMKGTFSTEPKNR